MSTQQDKPNMESFLQRLAALEQANAHLSEELAAFRAARATPRLAAAAESQAGLPSGAKGAMAVGEAVASNLPLIPSPQGPAAFISGDALTPAVTATGNPSIGVHASGTSGPTHIPGIFVSGFGVYGKGTSTIDNRGNVVVAYGLWGSSDSGAGVYGQNTGTGIGVVGNSDAGIGISGQSIGSYGVSGSSTNGVGVAGSSSNNIGVYGQCASGTAVQGNSTSGVGVQGSSVDSYGVWGYSTNNVGIVGASGSGTGVWGVSNGSGTGVWGNSNGGIGVQGGSTNSYGVSGSSQNNYGVYGQSTSSVGVVGSSQDNYGVWGTSTGSAGVSGQSTSGVGVVGGSYDNYGVWGQSTNSASVVGGSTNGVGVGVWGMSSSDIGVHGQSTSSVGVQGESSSSTGVSGNSIGGTGVAGSGGLVGVQGNSIGGTGVVAQSSDFLGLHAVGGGATLTPPTTAAAIFAEGGISAGIIAFNDSTSAAIEGDNDSGTGVMGNSVNGAGVGGHSNGGTGVDGQSTHGVGVWGESAYGTGVVGWGLDGGPGQLAGEFYGELVVTGPLNKLGGGFKIDHPLDPANKFLSHSFVESPDMKNVYDGVVMLDAHGEAVVELPAWFEALNQEFRYQLTPLGVPGPNLYIAEEISGQRFKIAGGSPALRVCWQVTGSRKDAWAQANQLVVEQEKPSEERGHYLIPELYGYSLDRSIAGVRHPEALRRFVQAQQQTSE